MSLARESLHDIVEEMRRRGRPRKMWLVNIKDMAVCWRPLRLRTGSDVVAEASIWAPQRLPLHGKRLAMTDLMLMS